MRISCAYLCVVFKISSAESCRSTCARSVYEDLVQDVCVKISSDYLRKICASGLLVQDLSLRMSAAGICRTTCAKSLHQCSSNPAGPLVEDTLINANTTLPAFRAMNTHDLRRRMRFEIRNQLYQHFARWTRVISAEGCTSKSEIATLPAFRAMDTHDLRRELHFEIRNRNFTSIPRTRHAGSPQRVALRNQKSQLYQHSAHSTRRISAESCTSKSEIATLPASRALDTHDLRRGFTFQNHASEVLRLPRNHEPRSYEMLRWPRKRFLKLKFQKCHPSQELSPLTAKCRIHGADSLHLPRKTQSLEWRTPANVLATSSKYCACHDFHNVSDSLHLPRKLTFLTSTCDGFLAPAMQNEVHARKRARIAGQTMPSTLRKSGRQLCASLRSRNQRRISKRHSCADETTGPERVP